jgi:hypothetical protein
MSATPPFPQKLNVEVLAIVFSRLTPDMQTTLIEGGEGGCVRKAQESEVKYRRWLTALHGCSHSDWFYPHRKETIPTGRERLARPDVTTEH